jgi:predicted  nucleic acid-binding Zn-ribbon protein
MTDLLLRTTHAISLALALSLGASMVHAGMPMRQEPPAQQGQSASDLGRESADLLRKIAETTKALEVSAKTISELREELAKALAKIEEMDRKIVQAEKANGDLRQALDEAVSRESEIRTELEDRKKKLAELGAQEMAVRDLQEERDALQRQVNDLQAKVAAEGVRIKALEKTSSDCSASLQQCKADVERAVASGNEWKKKFEDAEQKLAAAKAREIELSKECDSVKVQLAAKTQEAVGLSQRVSELELEVEGLKAEVASLTDQNTGLALFRRVALWAFVLSGLVIIVMVVSLVRRRGRVALPAGPGVLSAAMLAAERHLDRCMSELARSLASRDPNGEQEWLRAARRSHRIREAMASAARLPADGVDENVRRAVELSCGLAADDRLESKSIDFAFNLCKALHEHGVALLPERKRAACDATKGRTAVLLAEAFRQVMEAQQASAEQRKECLEWAQWALMRANDWFETKDDAPVHLERARLNLQQARGELDQSRKSQFLRTAKDQAEQCIKSLRPAGFAAVPGVGQAPSRSQDASPIPGPVGEAHLLWLDAVLQLLQAPQGHGLNDPERNNHVKWSEELAQSSGSDHEFRAVVTWRLAQIREASGGGEAASEAWNTAAKLSFRWSDSDLREGLGSLAFSPKGEYAIECLATLCRRELGQIDNRRRPDRPPQQTDSDRANPVPVTSDRTLVADWRKVLRDDVMRLASLKQWTAVGGRLAGQVQLEALPGVWFALKQRSMDDLLALKTVGTWTAPEVRAFAEALALLDGSRVDPVDPPPGPDVVAVPPNLALLKDPAHPTGARVLLIDFSCTLPDSRRGWEVEFERKHEIKHIGLFGNELGVVSLKSEPCLYAHPQGVRGVQLASIDLSNTSASTELKFVVRKGAGTNLTDLPGVSQPEGPAVNVGLRLDQLGIAPPAQQPRWGREEIIRFAEGFERLMWALLAISPEQEWQVIDAMTTSLAHDLKFDGEQLKRDCFTVDEYERRAVAERHQKFSQAFRTVVQSADCTQLWQQVVATRGNALDVIRRLLSRPEFASLRSAALRVGLPVEQRPDGEFGRAIGSAVPGGEFLVQFGEGAATVNQTCVLESSASIGRANAIPGDWVRVVGSDGAPRRVQLCPTVPIRGSCGTVASLRGESVQVHFEGHYLNFAEVTCRPEGAPVSSFTVGATVEVIDVSSDDPPRVTLRQAPAQPSPLPPVGSVSGWGEWFAECKRFLMAKAGSHPHGGSADPPSNGEVAAFMRALRHQADGRNVEVATRAQMLEQQGLALSRRYPPL